MSLNCIKSDIRSKNLMTYIYHKNIKDDKMKMNRKLFKL